MAPPLVPLLGLSFLACLAIYRFLIQPLFIDSLSKIPSAHWSAPLSRLWILNKRRQEIETPTIHEAHVRLGPVIRIAPNEVSVNCVDGGIRTIYGGGFEKGDWYSNVFTNYGVMPAFAMPDHGMHSKRKRMLSNVYAKSSLQSSPAMEGITQVIMEERLLPHLREMAEQNKPVELYDIFSALTLDFVSAYVFGLKNSSNFLLKPEMNQKFFRDYKARQRHQFWPQEVPSFTKFLDSIGLKGLVVPSWVNQANQDIEAWLLEMCDQAEITLTETEHSDEKPKPRDWPTVYAQLRNAMLKESTKTTSPAKPPPSTRLEIASELLDHTLAGFDTSSITLAYLAHELSLPTNAPWLSTLEVELSTHFTSNPTAPYAPKLLDALPALHATLMETLRLHAAIPGAQPRTTPPGAPTLLTAHTAIPPGTRIQAQAHSLHRSAPPFPDPETFHPARWLPTHTSADQLKEMHRWFWAFGSGGRMCVGSNLAVQEMKAVVAGVWGPGGVRPRVRGEVGGRMVGRGGYVAEPVGEGGRWCWVDLEGR